ncbi:hypothetical protein PV328_010437 [Microctonus aethiopoides]|uniref:HTH CENPB-type domain-containing protein n=1 Tax=Microctonus aethiopoides TaxID=144406 RepID=A0AA39KQG6_9HYME|nr:hypothetical protein PV328_010437 [Microctonus aethiopoides]
MVGKYVRKTNRQQWDPQAMENAIKAVQNGEMGWLKASKTFKVPSTTLRRRGCNANKRVRNNCTGLGRFITTFTPEQEKSIIDRLEQMEQHLFGITCKELRSLIYEWAEMNKIPHRFNKNEKRAGLDWIKGFRSRNPEIILQKPENTSIAIFFQTYQEIIDKYKLGPERIYNVDESGLSTVENLPRISASSVGKQVDTTASAEQGIHVTVICCTNPLGSYIPPAFIFPRKNWKMELLEGAPTGSVGFPQESGLMTGEIFQQWIKHFKKYTNSSKDSPVLLIMDGYVSHKNWGVLDYAKQHGIILLCSPAHCSHPIQPLDESFFSPLKTFLNQEVTKKIRGNDGRAISQLQVAGIFRPAYEKAATLENAASGFKNTGLWPLDPNIFPDYSYASSSVTDQIISPTNGIVDVHPSDDVTNVSDMFLAGFDWVRGYQSSNPEITLQKPENTSIARAMAFNKPNISTFFKTYQEIIDKYKLGPERIYNVDESELSTVQNPPKIFAPTGKKQTGTIAVAEKGIHVTVVCCTNPLGSYIPPAFIFPRKNWKMELLEGAPTGSVGFPQESGLMTGEIFQQWIKHFKKYSNSSKDSPVLLILDGHVSYKSRDVLDYAKQHGIILHCSPTHCSHHIQPLNVSFFSPLKTFLNQEITKKIRVNDGRAISQLQVAGIFRPAYEKAATLENATNGFKNTGLWPLDPNIFPDYLYAPSSVTDQNILSTNPIVDVGSSEDIANISDIDEERPTNSHSKEENQKIGPLITTSPSPSTSSKTLVKRKKIPAILTTNSFILDLKEKENAKQEEERRISAKKVKKKVCINNDDGYEENPANENSNLEDDNDAFGFFLL